MVFVTVGNALQSFRRLIEAVDELKGAGSLADEVVIQTGNTKDYEPRHCKAVPFVQLEEFARLVADAEVVISHAGAGSIIHVIRSGKTPVVMARRAAYGEHIDDHQSELVRALAAEGRIVAVNEAGELGDAITEARRRGRSGARDGARDERVEMIASALTRLAGRRR